MSRQRALTGLPGGLGPLLNSLLPGTADTALVSSSLLGEGWQLHGLLCSFELGSYLDRWLDFLSLLIGSRRPHIHPLWGVAALGSILYNSVCESHCPYFQSNQHQNGAKL